MPTHPKPPHHVVPKHETGYTDEAAEECHDLIDRAEEEAHLHEPNSMYSTQAKGEPPHVMKKGGLEGSSSSGAQTMGDKIQEGAKNMSSTAGQKMEQMKEAMGMNK
ncbi:CsbD-like domain-containing protein [Madurella fahalii]|uniref:CsbD-like domain-containing protein n=1 Tax=Madurella fahalii TaxID=1157608 RepID=A0ABQ0G0R2_9PEZI